MIIIGQNSQGQGKGKGKKLASDAKAKTKRFKDKPWPRWRRLFLIESKFSIQIARSFNRLAKGVIMIIMIWFC